MKQDELEGDLDSTTTIRLGSKLSNHQKTNKR